MFFLPTDGWQKWESIFIVNAVGVTKKTCICVCVFSVETFISVLPFNVRFNGCFRSSVTFCAPRLRLWRRSNCRNTLRRWRRLNLLNSWHDQPPPTGNELPPNSTHLSRRFYGGKHRKKNRQNIQEEKCFKMWLDKFSYRIILVFPNIGVGPQNGW